MSNSLNKIKFYVVEHPGPNFTVQTRPKGVGSTLAGHYSFGNDYKRAAEVADIATKAAELQCEVIERGWKY